MKDKIIKLASGRLASATMWNGLALLLARGLPVLGMLLAARVLGREAFGQLGILYTTIMMLHVFAVASLGIMATNFVARWRETDRYKAGIIVALCHIFSLLSGGIFFAGMVIFAEPIATGVLSMPDMVDEVKISGFVLFLVTIFAVQSGVLMGFEAYKSMALANFFGGVVAVIGLALGARWGGVAGALWGLAIATTLQNLLCAVVVQLTLRRHEVPFKLEFRREEMGIMWRFGVPSLLTLVIWSMPTWINSVYLVRQPGGVAEMGLLAAANQWFAALMFVPRVLTQVLLPIYSSGLSNPGNDEPAKLALRSGHLITIVAIPVVAAMVLLSPFIAALYGPEFADHGAVFVLMFAAAGVAAPSGALTNFLVARDYMWTRLTINIIWGIIIIGMAFFLIDYGARGLAFAAFVSYGIRTWLTYIVVRQIS